MAITAAELRVKFSSAGADKVKGDMDAVGDSVGKVEKQTGSFSQTLGKTGKVLTAGVTAPLTAFLTKAVLGASSLEQAQGKVNAVFGQSAPSVMGWAKTTADSYGITETAALQATGTIGNFFTSAGISTDQAAKYSKELVALSADMAAFNDVSSDRASEAIISGLAGEYDALQRLGININAAKVQEEALAIARANGREEITDYDKMLAYHNLLMRESANQQGQARREADGFAGSMARLQAKVSEFATRVGQLLIPIATAAVNKLSSWVDALDRISPAMLKWGVIAAAVAAALGPLLIAISMMLPALSALGSAFGLLLGPVGLVVAAIGLLAVAFTKNWFGIRDIVGGAIEAISGKIKFLVNVFNNLRAVGLSPVHAALQTLAVAFPALGKVIAPLRQTVDALADAFEAFRERNFAEAFDALGRAVRGIGSAIKAAIPGLGPALDLIGSLLAPIMERIRALIALFQAFRSAGVDPLTAALAALAVVFPRLASVVSPLVNAIGKLTSAFAKLIKGDFTGAFKDAAASAKQFLSSGRNMSRLMLDLSRSAIDFARAKLDDIFTNLERTFPGLASSIERFRSTLSNILSMAGSLASALSAALAGDWSGAWEHFKDAAQAAFDAVLDAVRVVPTLIVNLFQSVNWGAVWDGIRSAWDAIPWTTMARTAMDALAAAIRAGVGAAATIGRALFDMIRNAASAIDVAGIGSAIWDRIVAAGEWIAGQVLNIPSLIVDIASWVAGQIADLWEFLKDWVNRNGGILGLASVVISIAGWIAGKIADVWEFLKGWVNRNGGILGLASVVVSIAAWIAGKIADLWEFLKGWVLSKTGGVLSLPSVVVSVVSWIAGKIADVWEFLKGWVASKTGGVLSLTNVALSVVNWVAGKIADAWSALEGFLERETGRDVEITNVLLSVGAWSAGKIPNVSEAIKKFISDQSGNRVDLKEVILSILQFDPVYNGTPVDTLIENMLGNVLVNLSRVAVKISSFEWNVPDIGSKIDAGIKSIIGGLNIASVPLSVPILVGLGTITMGLLVPVMIMQWLRDWAANHPVETLEILTNVQIATRNVVNRITENLPAAAKLIRDITDFIVPGSGDLIAKIPVTIKLLEPLIDMGALPSGDDIIEGIVNSIIPGGGALIANIPVNIKFWEDDGDGEGGGAAGSTSDGDDGYNPETTPRGGGAPAMMTGDWSQFPGMGGGSSAGTFGGGNSLAALVTRQIETARAAAQQSMSQLRDTMRTGADQAVVATGEGFMPLASTVSVPMVQTQGAIQLGAAGWLTAATAGLGALVGAVGAGFGQIPGVVTPPMLASQLAVAASTAAMNTSATANLGTMAANAASKMSSMATSVASHFSTIRSKADSESSSTRTQVTSHMEGMASSSKIAIAGMQTGISVAMLAIKTSTVSNASEMAESVKTRLTNGAQQAVAGFRAALSQLPGIVSSVGGAAAGTAAAIGANIGNSLAAGMRSALGAVAAAASALVAQAEIAMRARAMIASPSKRGIWIGEMIGLGPAIGIRNKTSEVVKAATNYMDATLAALSPDTLPTIAPDYAPVSGTAYRGGAPVAITDNRTINVYQQPGEDAEALARRLFDLMEHDYDAAGAR